MVFSEKVDPLIRRFTLAFGLLATMTGCSMVHVYNLTVTDKNGFYSFTPRGTMHVEEGFLQGSSPTLVYFYPGYRTIGKLNSYHPDRRFEFIRQSDWHNKTIELETLANSRELRKEVLERFSSSLGRNLSSYPCGWTDIPRTLSAIRLEYKKLLHAGVHAKVTVGAPWFIDEMKKCPSADKFFEIYQD